MLLGLDSLMETVAPAASFHDTSCLLIHNLHLTVDNDIFVVLVEHGVGLEQLLQGVHTLALHGIVVEQCVLLVETLLIAELFVFESRKLRCDVGQHEELLVVHLLGEPFRTLVGEVARVEFLVNHEV